MRKAKLPKQKPLFRSIWVYFTVVMRLAGIAYIFVNPFVGTAISIFFDWADSWILLHIVGFNRREYHRLDKVIDEIESFVMLLVAWVSPHRLVFVLLFLYRFLGFLLYQRTRSVRVYLLFPNVFEFFFIWYIAVVPYFGITDMLPMWQILLLCFLLKEVHEYTLHWWWPGKLEQFKKTGFPRFVAHGQ